jgi:hypothetical protein
MASKLLMAFLACMMVAGLAGCTTKGADAAVKFDGEGNGIDADSTSCDDKGTLVGSGTVQDGEVTVRVMNGDEEIFQETYDGEIALDGRALNGDSGKWMIEATRSGEELLEDFNGEYTFRLDC